MTTTNKPGPKLQALLDAGTLRLSDGVYIGEASDGIVVQLGSIGEEDSIESYLTLHPSPTGW